MAPDFLCECSMYVVVRIRGVNSNLGWDLLPVREAPIVLARHAPRSVVLPLDHRLQAREDRGRLGIRRQVRTGQHCLPDDPIERVVTTPVVLDLCGVSGRWIGVHFVDDSTE